MKQLTQKTQAGQTIIELAMIIVGLVFLSTIGLFFLSTFEISQQQTMLLRTQAFIELGNYSGYSGSQPGSDDPSSEESQVIFELGKNSDATGVDLDDISSFQTAVEGELDVRVWGAQGGGETSEFWRRYRFPRAETLLSFPQLGGNLPPLPISLTLGIAHNRSVSFDGIQGDPRSYQGSSSIHFRDLGALRGEPLAQALEVLPDPIGHYDNAQVFEDILQTLVDEGAGAEVIGHAEELKDRGVDLNRMWSANRDGLINDLISFGLEFGLNALGDFIDNLGEAEAVAGQVGGDAAGGFGAGAGQAGGAAGGGFPGADLGGLNPFSNLPEFMEGAPLHNFGQTLTFGSSLMQTVNLGASLAGKNIEGLQTAAAITGGVGNLAQGMHQLGTFAGAGEGALASDFFGGMSKIAGGGAQISSQFDPDVSRAFGIASAATGLGAGITGLHENWGELGSNWARVGAVGGVVSQGGSLMQQVEPSDLGQGISLAGQALGTVGGVGTFGEAVSAGKFDGDPFGGMMATGALVGQASNLGAGVAEMTGHDATPFAYGAMAGGALAAVGMVGKLGEAAFEGLSNLGEGGDSDQVQKSIIVEDENGKKMGVTLNEEGQVVQTINLEEDAGVGYQSFVTESEDGSEIGVTVDKQGNVVKTQQLSENVAEAEGGLFDGVKEAFAGLGETFEEAGERFDSLHPVQQLAVMNNLVRTGFEIAASQGVGGFESSDDVGVGYAEVGDQLARLPVPEGMSREQRREYLQHRDKVRETLQYVSDQAQRGQRPDTERVVQALDSVNRMKATSGVQGASGRRNSAQPRVHTADSFTREIQQAYQNDATAWSLARQIEGTRNIVIENSDQRTRLQERARWAVQQIETHINEHYQRGTQPYYQLRLAQRRWERVSKGEGFISPEQALEGLGAEMVVQERATQGLRNMRRALGEQEDEML